MELLAYLLYMLASRSIPVFIGALILCIGTGTVVFPALIAVFVNRAKERQRPSLRVKALRILIPAGAILVFALSLLLGLLSLVNLIVPHFLDGELISSYGQKAEAKVISRENTGNLLNKRPVMRYKVLYKTADGRTIETYFESWDFNVYPPANSVSYPDVGETFRVMYLPSYPTAFLILTDDDSDYSRSRECGNILEKFEEAKLKLEFDPGNKDYQRAFEEATRKAVAAKCVTSTTEIKTDEQKELPARIQ